ncbi:Transcription factor [Macleaya cordata]|uniref:Transcription factor n=1 Tax=Macleaya cordata TaxID=56857 RepID=A0A200PR81_MACCD|nr:Transcription factor [Macleaya cordata]
MEEVGAQVAHPIFMHQPIPGRFYQAAPMSKKRDLSFHNPNLQQQQPQPQGQQQQQPQQQQQQQQQQLLLQQHRFQNPNSNWNPNVWNWDSVKFVAKPSSQAEVLHLGTAETHQRNKGEDNLKPMVAKKKGYVDEDGENLTLKLGGSLYSVDEPVARPNKRVRSGSPGGGSGSGGSYPMCQVDDCRGDLSNAKDYHRRHKVCELHSKTTKALVGKQMQRFCQQCSRFHPLSEFDEGKRSCRRRLAGHNRRRRKTQPEDVSSRMLLSGNQENSDSGNLDIGNLFKVLARLQGSNPDKNTNAASIPDRDRLIQIFSKINALPVAANDATRLPLPGGFDLNVSQEVSLEHSNKVNGNIFAPSTTDLLAIFSAALKASSPDALAILSQRSSHSDDDKPKLNCFDQVAGFHIQKNSVPGFPSVGGERSTSTFQSTVEVSSCQVQESRPSLPFQLFGSSTEGDSPPKLGSAWKYFSSDSSSPLEERSPSSSSPVVQKLFPLRTASEIMKHESMSISGEDNGMAEVSTTRGGWNPPLELFKRPNERVSNSSIQNRASQPGYTSSSGSDHSPSTSNSDFQDRTGRIIFKLFDKDPGSLPRTLRTEILNWLSHSPSEIESYIRPGCVVLSIYIAMPYTSWEQLQEDLLQRVKLLVRDSNSDFWRNGRFCIHTDRRLASHKDGKIRLCKSWRTRSAPELTSVSPLAVVGGKQTSLVLRGRNLTVPGTKIHCAYMGGYMSKEVTGSSVTLYDDTSAESFTFPSGIPNILGRCFIEVVENGFKGNSFPLIIADSTVCRELRLLEPELEVDARTGNVIVEDQNQDFERTRSREDILHFLNELGWLFQRKSTSSRPDGPDFSLNRFKFLFTFSVERDWCALVKTLLDILAERNLEAGALSRESLETLAEIHLLNKAVKRKCRNMVKLLIRFSLTCTTDASKKYLFFPSQMGPGGVTPLHLAASMHDSEDIVDALTDDPQQIGLSCWNSLSDANGQSPYAYASMRNNHNYNRLVARKIAEWKHGQVSIPIGDEISSLQQQKQQEPWMGGEEAERPNPKQLQLQSRGPCSRCAVVVTRHYMIPGTHGLLHRPYVHSMLAIAAVCVCVCLFLRGSPDIGAVAPFKWENLGSGIS